ncbi:MAG: GNAT family N-acyltransferase [Desulfuromonadales bacterium]|nr:GNAT family N-acyltransferase [Desulfuromonadales bacterium]
MFITRDGSLQTADQIDLPAHPVKDILTKIFGRPLARALGLATCNCMYLQMDREMDAGSFAEKALQELGVGWNADGFAKSGIPKQGATVVVSNHPFGGIEGLVLISLLKRLRQDVKVLANPFLWRVPELRDALIPIDPYATRQSRRRNVKPLREAYRWLDDGGLLVVFPAGEVSHFHLRSRMVMDPVWQKGVGRLIAYSKAAVVPVYFPGCNSLGFQITGMIHPRVRTLLLARQLLNKQERIIEVRIGQKISARRLQQIGSLDEQLHYLRLRTYLLGSKDREESSNQSADRLSSKGAQAPLAEPVPAVDLQQQVDKLPAECLLLENGSQRVYCIKVEQAPGILREIGRLRERTFRQHGEGTGRSLDLDHFDAHYRHLFLWESERLEIIGAYRIGQVDKIMAEQGLEGIYANTLFKIRSKLFAELPPALELGRSFVRMEYQRSFSPLLLLWQGIGRYLVRNPRYRVLYGPVSISREYSDFSRQLMTRTLYDQLRLPELSRYVAPRLPVLVRLPQVKGCPLKSTRSFARNIEMMSALVADVEADLNGIPVLLRHYMNLGGKLLAFNRDPEFSDVIDGLILVDLDQAKYKTLKRYMGSSGTEAYLAHMVKARLAAVA